MEGEATNAELSGIVGTSLPEQAPVEENVETGAEESVNVVEEDEEEEEGVEEEDTETIEDKRRRVREYMSEHNYELAAECYDQILSRIVDEHGEACVEAALAMMDCGSVYLELAKKKNEEACYKEVLKQMMGQPEEAEGGEESGAHGEGEAGGGGGEGEEEEDLLEVAWNMLEMARVVLTKQGAGDLTKTGPEAERLHLSLTDVRVRLGDLALEQSYFDQAIEDYKAALDIREKVLAPHDRRLAEIHSLTAEVYVAADKPAEAMTSYRAAITVIEKAIAEPSTHQAEREELGTFVLELNANIAEMEAKQTPKQPTANQPVSSTGFDKKSANAGEAVSIGVVGVNKKRLTPVVVKKKSEGKATKKQKLETEKK